MVPGDRIFGKRLEIREARLETRDDTEVEVDRALPEIFPMYILPGEDEVYVLHPEGIFLSSLKLFP